MAIDHERHEISSFVVRIWLENPTSARRWRGHVTHVLSGERRHFDNLAVMNEFITCHIGEMSIRPDDN